MCYFGWLQSIDVVGFRGDHIIHFVLFLPWTFLVSMVGTQSTNNFPRAIIKKGVLSLISGIFVVAALEYARGFVPGRGSNITDLISGAAGVLFSTLSYYAWLLYYTYCYN